MSLMKQFLVISVKFEIYEWRDSSRNYLVQTIMRVEEFVTWNNMKINSEIYGTGKWAKFHE